MSAIWRSKRSLFEFFIIKNQCAMQNEDDSTDVDYIYVEILLSHFRCKVYYGNK